MSFLKNEKKNGGLILSKTWRTSDSEKSCPSIMGVLESGI